MVLAPWLTAPFGRLFIASPCLLLCVALHAQSEGSTATDSSSKPAAQDPAAQDPAPSSTEASFTPSVDTSGPFARVERPVELQVWSTELSPRYAETLGEGAVVRVGDVQRTFREVILPLGVRGYVHKKFTTSIEDGRIRSTTPKLAFRYRPQTGEAPVAFVDEDQEFVVTGSEGDWWIVRFPSQSAWVPADSLVTFEDGAAETPSDATLVGAYTELARQHWQASRAFVGEIAEGERLAKLAADRAATFEGLRGTFAAELDKPVSAQRLDAVRTEVESFMATLEPESPELAIATRFRDRIDTQMTIIEATKFVGDSAKKPVPGTEKRQPVVDPLARFDAIGWLRYEKPFAGEPTISLVKGGQVLHYLTCSTGRYDLRMFDGLEVGMNGPRDRPNWQSIRTLDVERIEVLGRRLQ